MKTLNIIGINGYFLAMLHKYIYMYYRYTYNKENKYIIYPSMVAMLVSPALRRLRRQGHALEGT